MHQEGGERQRSTQDTDALCTPQEYTGISLRFGLSFTRNPCFYHRKNVFLKTPAKVEISENAGYVLPCQLGESGF